MQATMTSVVQIAKLVQLRSCCELGSTSLIRTSYMTSFTACITIEKIKHITIG